MPSELENKKVLVVPSAKDPGGKWRIIVDSTASLSDPVAGDEYPTDSSVPASVQGKKVLVLGIYPRFIVDIQKAKAGIDFPTDGPASLDRDFLVWAFSDTKRLALNKIHAIEKAKAGIDYPTDGPAGLNRDFYVAVTVGSDGFIRNRLP